ncbi:hypothetical protein NF867_04875 [Solitalea sp. MAHUQ-68]|uniref:Uncharacterized protein n=1 Tax=Solitalea agri TaxID=2953739 RepID=A0A9X2JBP8_9SPHI|nr:hypothetical protein [Solitalea agri]MCO4292193.1 hypothetical protein [Solitalea agri]
MIEDLKKAKYYLVALALALGGYVWVNQQGIRFLGDDNESKEQRSGYTRSYYHK